MKVTNCDFPNVYAPDRAIPEKIKLHPFLLPVVTKLAKKALGVWEFKCHNFTTENIARSVIVLDNEGNEAGRIDIHNKWGKTGYKDLYAIKHFSIKKSRGTPSTLQTTKPDVAYRLAIKHFGVKSVKDLMDEAKSRVRLQVQGMENSLNMTLAARAIEKPMFEFVLQRQAEFVATLKNEKEHQAFERTKSVLDSLNMLKSVSDETQLSILRIENNKVHVSNPNSTDINIYSIDAPNMPGFIRMKLGMLKLVEDGKVIENVGIRISEKLFAITQGNNND
jgi:hypothetical protein